MASIHQIRGALLEEIVLFLLSRSGYRRVQPGEEGTRTGRAGLEVEGRGSRHQIDALVTPLHSHAFIYPIRLLVEAKCETKPVGLSTVRSVVGTLFDINQNYFAGQLPDRREVQVQRFNYHAAMFAANGYSANAERYALAHQVFLIDYTNVISMRPVVNALLALDLEDFGELAQGRRKGNFTEIRNGFRVLLEERTVGDTDGILSDRGVEKVRAELLPAVKALRGSYYGMIEGIYPVHLISLQPIPLHLIQRTEDIPCEIRVSADNQSWAFEPSGTLQDGPDFFRLEFTIPKFIAEILNARMGPEHEDRPRWRQVADIKHQYMRFIDVTAVEEGRLFSFRLTLDVDWLNRYVQNRQARAVRRRNQEEPQG